MKGGWCQIHQMTGKKYRELVPNTTGNWCQKGQGLVSNKTGGWCLKPQGQVPNMIWTGIKNDGGLVPIQRGSGTWVLVMCLHCSYIQGVQYFPLYVRRA
jgi:hypothetical protein